MQKMYLLVAISTRRDREEFLSLFSRLGVSRTYSLPCRGTVLAGTRDLLGLEDTEKAVHFAPMPFNEACEVMDALTHEVGIDLPQKGIALLIPLNAVSGITALGLWGGGRQEDEMKGEPFPMETDKELIVIVCEGGHTEEVMQAARSAGAGGGTVLHAKGTGTEMAQKFYGMTLAEEKEMVLIVTKTEYKKRIMQAISDAAGPRTPARAVSFSLPVSHTAGLRFFDE